ncbi:FadR/GntR family transcriptional regulator [Mesorhizobium sp. LHD-90]|uniref:FadR/GntR family transcriptional regulator n=1 Tax=Mesorhizobium sp. LHD-90 TaxID=3071414 RepID=UPI0027E0266E|nr:FadR/GntR family transcriptional regulator [Mesorhizobium sp. LHD-90]MDQ6433867.1 FadR/GntR family transcriptional regulator [Mesorhizobium sp. LHD-90]
MTPLDQLRPIEVTPSASEKVAERLLSLIASGNIAPGDKLPSENQLSKALHVSRPVVREALRGLTMMGVVETRQGGGSYVTDLKPNRLMAPLSFVLSLQDYSLDSLFTARTVIDGGLAAEAARSATPAQLERFAELVEVAYRTVADPVAFRLADVEFHELVGTASDNAFLDRVSRSLYSLAIDQRRKASETPGVLDQSAKDHDAIVRAIGARDPEAAEAAMVAHVEHIRKTTLDVLAGADPVPFRIR